MSPASRSVCTLRNPMCLPCEFMDDHCDSRPEFLGVARRDSPDISGSSNPRSQYFRYALLAGPEWIYLGEQIA